MNRERDYREQLILENEYTIDGISMTGEQIRDNIIEASILKGELSRLLRGERL